jgi:hypothetical protein
MKEYISRHEKQYIDIEDFKDYELTNCISFEMAIRNKEALRLATDITLLQFYSISNYINLFIENQHSIIQTSEVTGLSIDTLKLIKLNCKKNILLKPLRIMI